MQYPPGSRPTLAPFSRGKYDLAILRLTGWGEEFLGVSIEYKDHSGTA
jgi:hypothetical protein